jgi:hypothetical protein
LERDLREEGKESEALSRVAIRPMELVSPLATYAAGARKEAVMLVERGVPVVDVEVIGEAYEIAAAYLKQAA